MRDRPSPIAVHKTGEATIYAHVRESRLGVHSKGRYFDGVAGKPDVKLRCEPVEVDFHFQLSKLDDGSLQPLLALWVIIVHIKALLQFEHLVTLI
jgi:hypothetical protein